MPEEIEYQVDTSPRAKPINEMDFDDISREIATGTTGRSWEDFRVGDKTIGELLAGSKKKTTKKRRSRKSKKEDEPVTFRDAFPELVEGQ